MKKMILAGALVGALEICSIGAASPLVTSNVPLDSNYYIYLDKLEAMGYVQDMPTGTKPYSRLDMAKWLLQAQQVAADKPMPIYLSVYFKEMAEDLQPEMDYLQGDGGRFSSNLKLRNVNLGFIYADMDQSSYKYGNGINAGWQPLNSNNNGYRYGDGLNAIGKVHIGGSLNEDFAMGLTPRFSYDKDQDGDASLEEGYVKTHLGVWGIELGKQPLQWGGAGHNSAFAMSNNATPQTMVKLNLLEPHTFENGLLKFLGKANVNVFYSRLEGNRVERAQGFGSPNYLREEDHAGLLGVRVDITPTEQLTIGAERVSMLKGFNKDWFTGENAYEDDQWNDIAGLDIRYRFPGLQIYGSTYGEDQAGAFPSERAYSAGLYFPQLTKDGSWDLRLEASKTNKAWYSHWTFANGWTYRDDILGDAMGKDAQQYIVELNHYLDSGDRLGLTYLYREMDRDAVRNPEVQELQLSYSRRLKENMYMDAMVGFADIANVGYTDKDDNTMLVGVGLRWEY